MDAQNTHCVRRTWVRILVTVKRGMCEVCLEGQHWGTEAGGSQWLADRLAEMTERATGSGADRVSKNKGVTEVHPNTERGRGK